MKADDELQISVYGFVYSPASSDAFQVFPCHEYTSAATVAYMVMSGPGTVTNTTQGGSQGTQLSAVLIVNCDNPMTNVRIFPSVTVIPVGGEQ